MDVDELIGLRVRDLRTRLGWSQPRLAQELERFGFEGASGPTISRLEHGKRERRRVSVEEWLTLALALRVPPVDLLTPLSHGGESFEAGSAELPNIWMAYQWLCGLSTTVVTESGTPHENSRSAYPYANYVRFVVFHELFTMARENRVLIARWDEFAPPNAPEPDPKVSEDVMRRMRVYGTELEEHMRKLVELDMPLPSFPRAYLWDLAQVLNPPRHDDFPVWLAELHLSIEDGERP